MGRLAAVKGAFSDPPDIQAQNPDGLEVEHMWLLHVDFDGRQLQGTLINSPQSLRSFHEGDQVTITGKQISDWMYVENQKLVGGYTLRVLRDTLPEDERKEFDSSLPFSID